MATVAIGSTSTSASTVVGSVGGSNITAYGSVDDQAYGHSPQMWVDRHRGAVTAAALSLVAAAVVRFRG